VVLAHRGRQVPVVIIILTVVVPVVPAALVVLVEAAVPVAAEESAAILRRPMIHMRLPEEVMPGIRVWLGGRVTAAVVVRTDMPV